MATKRSSLALLGIALAAAIAVGLALPNDSPAVEYAPSAAPDAGQRIFFLNIRGQVLSVAPDGSDMRVVVDGLDTSPDGIAVDAENGHVYWSNMGRSKEHDGSVVRADFDGGNVTTIVPSGSFMTGKQLTLDKANRKLYWSDREGMRVWRANVDGSNLELLVEIASGDQARENAANWAVGIAVDPERGHVYWSQKGGDNEGVGSIRRAGLEIPAGQTAANRQDIEILFADLPEPIDLELDLANREIYWTDRGDAPEGNTVNRAPMDPLAGFDPHNRRDVAILMRDLDEGIGIAIDFDAGRMFVTDLRGSLYSANLDGSDKQMLGTDLGSLTGITIADPPESTDEN